MNSSTHSLNFTVAIVTYNGALRLVKVLEKLKEQINLENLKWEVLVVDNNSKDSTKTMIENLQKQESFPFILRYTFEEKQGAGYGRQRAIREANSPLIGFLDDDNLPTQNWVISAYQFAQDYPQAGAYGSQIHGNYEIEPPPNFERIKAFLAITERGNEPLLYDPKSRFLPPSAGLVVRQKAWLETVPENCILTGPTTENLLTSEDLEALSYLQQSAWEIWYNSKMKVIHEITANRLTKEYLKTRLGGIGLSRYITRTVGVNPMIKPLIIVAYFINDLRKIIFHCLKYGFFIQEDIVAVAEREFLMKSLISPLYFWFLKAF